MGRRHFPVDPKQGGEGQHLTPSGRSLSAGVQNG